MAGGLLLFLLASAFISDARSMKIPNRLTACGTIAGTLWHICSGGWAGLAFSVTGLLAGFLTMLILYGVGAVGAGDVKLFAAIGAIAGTGFTLYCLIYSLLYAAVAAVIVLIVSRPFLSRVGGILIRLGLYVWAGGQEGLGGIKRQGKLKFPFMYAVLPAGITVWFFVDY